MRSFHTTLAAFAAAAVLVSSAFAQENAQGLYVHDPYARVMSGVGGTGAVFFVLHNHGDADVTLTGASTDQADMAGAHTHLESADGMMQMMSVDGGIVLPAGGEHAFVRGGDHIMLMGLHEALKPGDVITVTLTFDGADPLTFDAVIDNERAPEMVMGAAEPSTTGHSQHHPATTAADTTGMTDQQAVVAVMKVQFETPETPLTFDPVVVQGDHALASWAQGTTGGRSLLERRDGVWRVVLCGGPELRLPEFLGANGVPAPDMLSQMFNAAEDALGADNVALYSSFQGVVMISKPQE